MTNKKISIHCKNADLKLTVIKYNCQHWDFNENTCQPTCSLNLTEKPNSSFCNNCTNRLSYPEEKEQNTNVKTEVKEPKLKEKAISYVKAETSQIVQGRVSKKVFEKRKKICLECKFLKNKDNGDSIGWCSGGCGCSVGNPRAALSQKLYMPSISCPKGKFGREQGNGSNVNDILDSVKGILTSVKNFAMGTGNT